MSITPIQLNAVLARTPETTVIKHNEDSRAALLQTSAQARVDKNVEQKLNQVRKGDETGKKQDRSDAKEKGNNEYHGDGGKHRRGYREEVTPEGRMVVKKQPSFDAKV